MSVQIASDETINKIINFLTFDPSCSFGKSGIKRITKLDIDQKPDREKLGQLLLDMNYQAYDARYNAGHGPEEPEDTPQKLDYQGPRVPTEMEAHKALRFWCYQCGGDGPQKKTKLYKFLEEYNNMLALRIMSRLPEYQQLPWA